MISYELALKLKEAGFPIKDREDCEIGNCWENGHEHCYPTLSELIEACGDRFINLERLRNNKWVCNKEECCLQCNPEGWDNYDSIGETAEEAVASLYIKLHVHIKI